MIVRVGMIQCFLFHVLTGGRWQACIFGKHTSRLIKRFPQNVKTNLDDCDDDEYKKKKGSQWFAN